MATFLLSCTLLACRGQPNYPSKVRTSGSENPFQLGGHNIHLAKVLLWAVIRSTSSIGRGLQGVGAFPVTDSITLAGAAWLLTDVCHELLCSTQPAYQFEQYTQSRALNTYWYWRLATVLTGSSQLSGKKMQCTTGPLLITGFIRLQFSIS